MTVLRLFQIEGIRKANRLVSFTSKYLTPLIHFLMFFAPVLIEVTTTYAPETISSPSLLPSTEWKTAELSSVSSTELKSTEYSISAPLTNEGQVPVQKESKKTAKEGWMTNTRIGLITGGFAFLLCLCAILMIAFLR